MIELTLQNGTKCSIMIHKIVGVYQNYNGSGCLVDTGYQNKYNVSENYEEIITKIKSLL